MALDGRSQLYKCILFVINVALGLIGFAIMVLGMWVRFSGQTSGIFSVDLNTTPIVTVVTLLIVLGLLMMVISAFGNYGTCKESNGALTVFWSLPGFSSGVMRNILDQSIGHLANFFSFLLNFFPVRAVASYEISEVRTSVIMLLSFQLIFTIVAGTLAIVKSEEAGELLLHAYATTYTQYVAKGGDPSMAIMLHFIHNVFGCCGIIGGLDPLVKQTCPKKGILESITLPSCPGHIATINYKGPFIGGLFGLLVLMILALICSIFLRKGISSSSDLSYKISVSTIVQANR